MANNSPTPESCAAKTLFSVMSELYRNKQAMSTKAIKSFLAKEGIISEEELLEKGNSKDEWWWQQTKKYSQYYADAGLIQKTNKGWEITESGAERVNTTTAESIMSFVLSGKDHDYSLKKHIMERYGVCAVEKYFCDLGWIFRERGHTDYGIDADVEVADSNMMLTSRHIAIQIKAGKSYIQKDSDGNIVFYFDNWHLRYWKSSDRPLIVMVYDPNEKKLYWQNVNTDSISRPGALAKIRLKEVGVKTDKELIDILLSFTPAIIRIPADGYSSSLEKYYVDRIKESIKILHDLLETSVSTIKSNINDAGAVLDILRIELSHRLVIDEVLFASFDEQQSRFYQNATSSKGITKKDLKETVDHTAEVILSGKQWKIEFDAFHKLASVLKKGSSFKRRATICETILFRYEKILKAWLKKYYHILFPDKL